MLFRNIAAYIRGKAVFSLENREQRLEFAKSLSHDCARLLPWAVILSLFSWLPYLYLDKQIFPQQPMAIFRAGLSLVGLGLLVPLFAFKQESRNKYGLALLLVPLVYLQIATLVITVMSGSDPAYLNGLVIVIMIIPFLPIPFLYAATILFVSFAVYLLFIMNTSLRDAESLYLMQNVLVAYFLAALFSYLTNILRQDKFIKENNLVNSLQQGNDLLANVLPKETAYELIAFGSTEPVKYEKASVMFTDFTGFTQVSKNMSPHELLNELDSVFSYFDLVTGEHNLEKLKTIGDAYMCAGGIPGPNSTHAVDIILAAFKILDFIQQEQDVNKRLHKKTWGIRIGIHTGPLVAGVIGKKKFAYDVWGDTVNLASRMESHGRSGYINISETTYNEVKDFFVCRSRGEIKVKNSEKVKMYFVSGIRKELSEDADGRTRNALFLEKYKILKYNRW